MEKTSLPHSPELDADEFQQDASHLSLMHRHEVPRSAMLNNEAVVSQTNADISSNSLDSKLLTAVSLYSDSDLTSSSLLRQLSASTAEANGVGFTPVAVKSSSGANFGTVSSKCLSKILLKLHELSFAFALCERSCLVLIRDVI
jgi:hypothetical protein